jgi:hypothetical protein
MTSDLTQSLREVPIALAPFEAIDIVATGRSSSGVGLAHLDRSTVFAGEPECRYGSHARRSFGTGFGASSKSAMRGLPGSGHR